LGEIVMAAAGHPHSLAVRALLRRPNLTVERERDLLRICRTGDEVARRQALAELWECHTKLVVAVARQFRRPDLDMTDLIGAGHLGLHAAIEGFDADRYESRLCTYAVNWIRHHIQDFIRRHAFPVRPPASPAHRQLFRTPGRLFADARRSCLREGIEPTDAELCARVGARLGLSGDEVAQCLSLARGDAVSFDAAGGERDTRPLRNRLVAQDASPEEAVILRLDQAKLRRRVIALTKEVLGERERKVFLARCLATEDGARHRESLAAELGVTRERIYQLEVSAKRKIAAALARDGLIDPKAASADLPKVRAPRRSGRRTADTPV
jgi:RNA polymerase sigma factor (sigma-70 family)